MPLIQLVAYGAQDKWLTGCPDITFFRTTYTNKSISTSSSNMMQLCLQDKSCR